MSRMPDVENKKKRIKSISLNEKTYLILKKVSKLDPNFNFSSFVNSCIESVYSDDLETSLIREEIRNLKEKRNKTIKEIDSQIDFLNAKLEVKNDKKPI